MSTILTIPRDRLPPLPEAGAWRADVLEWLGHGQWCERAIAEHDESRLQPVVYLVLRDCAGAAWCYARTGGDARLHGRWSCGIGGHVDQADLEPGGQLSDSPVCALRREIAEELGPATEQHFAAWPAAPEALIYESLSAVGRVHLGLLYCAIWTGEEVPSPVRGEALEGLGFRRLDEIVEDPHFELWSRLAARYLMERS